MAAVAASLSTDTEAMSFGLRLLKGRSTPSTMHSGLESLKVLKPRTSRVEASPPGAPEPWMLVIPARRPVSMLWRFVPGAFMISLLVTCETEPITNCFFCVPYPTTTTSSTSVASSCICTSMRVRPETGISTVL